MEGVKKIAHEKAPRLLRDSEKPLEANVLYPFGCPARALAQEIESAAEADCHYAFQAVGVSVHEEFLLWVAQADDEQIGLCISYFLAYCNFVRFL